MGMNNSRAIIARMTEAELDAMLTFFNDRWENDVRTGDLGDHCARLGIDRQDLGIAAAMSNALKRS